MIFIAVKENIIDVYIYCKKKNLSTKEEGLKFIKDVSIYFNSDKEEVKIKAIRHLSANYSNVKELGSFSEKEDEIQLDDEELKVRSQRSFTTPNQVKRDFNFIHQKIEEKYLSYKEKIILYLCMYAFLVFTAVIVLELGTVSILSILIITTS
jgi:hypothetical protein